MKTLFILLFIFSINTLSYSDEIKLSYLEIKENTPLHYSFLLKLVSKDNKKLPIDIMMSNDCKFSYPKKSILVNTTYLDSWNIYCSKPLEGTILTAKGLDTTGTDMLVHIELLSGLSHTTLLGSTKSTYTIPMQDSSLQIIKTYTWLGITHILLGFDHLLFVFALLLIVKHLRTLLLTVTAFTLAHSLTMAAATLDIVHMPQAPVEAVIALSILFLAMEIIHEQQGKIGLTSRYPWMIAFIFGLLHGFGFAGALAEIGLPQHAIPLALIFFNIGVEIGQLTFITSIVIVVILLQRLTYPALLNKLQTLVVYMIGGLSSFWLIERTLSF